MRVQAKRRARVTPEMVEFFESGGGREGGGVGGGHLTAGKSLHQDFKEGKLGKVGVKTE